LAIFKTTPQVILRTRREMVNVSQNQKITILHF